MLGVATIVIAAALWWQNRNHTAVPGFEPALQPPPAKTVAKAAKAEKAPTDEEITLARQTAMAQLHEAIKSVPEAKPVEGIIARRPDFVAEFEWELLQQMAAKDPDRQATLTHLVNKLLFFKKYNVWESLSASGDSVVRRHALAKEILTMIPGQMQVLGPEQAREMERGLLADLGWS